MIGKTGIFWTAAFLVAILAMFMLAPNLVYSAQQQTGGTKMNVTIRGAVSISISPCLTTGIQFKSTDPGDTDVNASCNNITVNLTGGTAYNLTVDATSTVNVNFTHASNRTNLTTGTYYLAIANVTYNSNSTANFNETELHDPDDSDPMEDGDGGNWGPLEDCDNLGDNKNCWITYYIDIPSYQPPGNYFTGYCWCGRDVNGAETLCGECN
jgi:hypothetical protein